MKKTFLLLLLFSSFFADAQSLKEALFSGRLKKDPGMVIRKGDDLSTKMVDTTARRTPERDTLAIIAVATPTDSVQQNSIAPLTTTGPATVNNASVTNQTTAATTANPVAATTDEEEEGGEEAGETAGAASAPKPKTNTAIWKDYVKTLTPTLKAEVLSSKKVKKGSYYVLVSYAIDTDGKTTITDVFVSPENDFLQQQISERINLEIPQLSPVLNSAGNARKVNKKFNFTIEKE